jgi:hypothetical protein
VATQKNFDPNRFSAAEIEKIKLEDGIRLHEIRIRRLRSAHRCEMTIPASMVLPKPTSSASKAPLDSGELKANRAASTW